MQVHSRLHSVHLCSAAAALAAHQRGVRLVHHLGWGKVRWLKRALGLAAAAAGLAWRAAAQVQCKGARHRRRSSRKACRRLREQPALARRQPGAARSVRRRDAGRPPASPAGSRGGA